MYEGFKQVIGLTQKKTVPLKSATREIITDPAKQMDHWIEHYSELYCRENTISSDALYGNQCLPTMHELDSEPTLDDLGKAMDALTLGKAPGKDGIPIEIISCSKCILMEKLYKVLGQCWRKGAELQDIKDTNTITLYKNKSDSNSCQGISLLIILGKLYLHCLKKTSNSHQKSVLGSQHGFRAQWSTIDMVFFLRQLLEKCRVQRKPFYIAFIDLTKTFDLVSIDGLFQILMKIRSLSTLLSVIKSFHDSMQETIVHNGSTQTHLIYKVGVKQECVLTPTPFGIFFFLQSCSSMLSGLPQKK